MKKKKSPEKVNRVLLEIGSEEIPAGYLKPAAFQLKDEAVKALEAKNIVFKDVSVSYTVRRFILSIEGIADKQNDLSFEKKGPRYDIAYKDGSLTDIGKTFLQKNGVPEKTLKIKEEKGQRYLFLDVFEKGRPSKKVLAELFPELIKNLRFPKSMTWEPTGVSFARPLRWIACLYNKEVIPFRFGAVRSGNRTRLHKFELSDKEAVVKDAGSYFGLMKKNGIITGQEERKKEILDRISRELSGKKLKILGDEGLLEMLAGSVETVSVMAGKFDEKYLFLPKEVIITAMKEHQRYFAVLKADGSFTNYFVNVRDGGSKNNAFITARHATVLFSRLNDAEFFYKEDLKTPLEKNIEKLKDAMFISGLGTMYEKMERLKAMAARAKEIFGYPDTDLLQAAVYLSKADLMTNMVGEKEYAGLRGFMGGVYLEKQGKEEKIYRAVGEHYLPNMAGDALPSTKEGLILSMLDKMDNITGFYIAGFKPTGSKDPYAVRRQALNIIYMVVEKRIDIDLGIFIYESGLAYRRQLNKETDIAEITEFFRQREIYYFKDKGIDYDIISAVAAGKIFNVVCDLDKAGMLMKKRKAEKAFGDIIFAVSRVANIIPPKHEPGRVDRSLFEYPEEGALYDRFISSKDAIASLIEEKKYNEAYEMIAGFKPSIDAYFEKVMVMAQDKAKQSNRLNTLSEIRGVFYKLADFSKLVIDRK